MKNCRIGFVRRMVLMGVLIVSTVLLSLPAAEAVANAALYVAENPFAPTVTLELAAGAKLHADGVQLMVTSVKYDGTYQKIGDHTADAFIVGGGTLALANELVIYKAYYVDGDGVRQPLKRGVYTANDGSPISSYLTGEGALRVRKTDLPVGLMLRFR